MITGTYNLVVDPQWRNVQLQEVFLECDTTLGAVTINLFEISELNRFWNVKIIIADVSNNASVNNITINAGGTNYIAENGTVQIVLNADGESVAFQVVSDNSWIPLESVPSGGGGIPTLQQVLDFNHDLVDGNNFQGTGAGVGNTGTNVIGIGTCSAFSNSGSYVTASGYQSAYTNSGNYVTASGSYSAYCNTGNFVTASGTNSAYCNTGSQVTASGTKSAYCNIGSNVTASGYRSAFFNTGSRLVAIGSQSAYCNTGTCVTASGFYSAYRNTGDFLTASGNRSASCNTGNCVTASGYRSAYSNTGNNVIALGTCAGWNGLIGNGISQSVILSSADLPTYLNFATASASITILAGGVTGNTYLYHDQTTNSIGSVRL